MRILAVLVNATTSPERETVTLLNVTPNPIDLAGWKLLDKAEAHTSLTGKLAAGEARVFVVAPPMALSNKGGLISLVTRRASRSTASPIRRPRRADPAGPLCSEATHSGIAQAVPSRHQAATRCFEPRRLQSESN